MASSKLQNIVVRTMQRDLEMLEQGKIPGRTKQVVDSKAEEMLKQAQSVIRQAEAERGIIRPRSKTAPAQAEPSPKEKAQAMAAEEKQKAEAERKKIRRKTES